MGSLCQLNHKNSSWDFFLEIFLKSHTFTLQSSEPVTMKWVAIAFQSHTFISLSWAFTTISGLLDELLISTICKCLSEEPTLKEKSTWSKDMSLVGRKHNILHWSLMTVVLGYFLPWSESFIVFKDLHFAQTITSCQLSNFVRIPVKCKTLTLTLKDYFLRLISFVGVNVIG